MTGENVRMSIGPAGGANVGNPSGSNPDTPGRPGNDDLGLSIPPFTGTNEGCSIQDFIRAVDEAQGLKGWDDKKTARIAKIALKGKVKQVWLRLAEESHRKRPNMDVWKPPVVDGQAGEGGLRAELLATYGPAAGDNLVEAERVLNNLRQAPGERVEQFVTRVEDAVDAYLNIDPCPIADAAGWFFDRLMAQKLRHGWRQSIASYITFHAKNERDVDKIIAAAKFYQTTPQGQAELTGSRVAGAIQNDVESIQGTTEEDFSTVGAIGDGENWPRKKGAICKYCGLKNHTVDICIRKKRDLEKGINRERCEGYPLQPAFKRFKDKKKAQKDKKVAASAASTPQQSNSPGSQQAAAGPAPPPPPSLGLNQNQTYNNERGMMPYNPALAMAAMDYPSTMAAINMQAMGYNQSPYQIVQQFESKNM